MTERWRAEVERIAYGCFLPDRQTRDILQLCESVAAQTREEMRQAVLVLVQQWRAMVEASFADGPIPGDEIGHASRWEMLRMSADELDALLAQAPDIPAAPPATPSAEKDHSLLGNTAGADSQEPAPRRKD